MDLRKALGWAWVALPALALDRITKIWAVEKLAGTPDILPGVLGLRLALNRGVAFSMLSDSPGFAAALSAVIIAVMLVLALRSGKSPAAVRIGLWLMVSGGAGNLYDRLAYGHVVDMLEFRFTRFAVFNVADVCVCAGAFIAALGYVLQARAERKGKDSG